MFDQCILLWRKLLGKYVHTSEERKGNTFETFDKNKKKILCYLITSSEDFSATILEGLNLKPHCQLITLDFLTDETSSEQCQSRLITLLREWTWGVFMNFLSLCLHPQTCLESGILCFRTQGDLTSWFTSAVLCLCEYLAYTNVRLAFYFFFRCVEININNISEDLILCKLFAYFCHLCSWSSTWAWLLMCFISVMGLTHS